MLLYTRSTCECILNICQMRVANTGIISFPHRPHMYEHCQWLASLGSTVYPTSFGCCPIDGIGREAHRCRHMVGRSSLTETRECRPLLYITYQVYDSTLVLARGTCPLSYNRHAVSVRQRRVEDDWNMCQCTSCRQRRSVDNWPPSSKIIHVYYEKGTYAYHEIITTLC